MARVNKIQKVEREFLMPDGTVKAEHELTPEEKKNFAQKVMDVLLVPLAYEAVMNDLKREKDPAI